MCDKCDSLDNIFHLNLKITFIANIFQKATDKFKLSILHVHCIYYLLYLYTF